MKSIYSLHPSYKMWDSSIRNLKERTGKPLEDWMAILKKKGPATDAERRAWLAREHAITTNYASWIVEEAAGRSCNPNLYDPEDLVAKMFESKPLLVPIFDKLLKMGLAAGAEAKACPCATIVPLFRNHVFAQIKPSTRTRVDIGFALGAMKHAGRLVSTGGYEKKDRITHRIPIATIDEIDGEVKKWLKTAYDTDAGK
ncbi:MAG: DUF4287 domain-containing protein [Planctomycetes bacterium]|nr:DUF4287 domain-containing protein [Planctomycetota bacterium]